MEFRLLGPVEVAVAGRPVVISRRQERCVLAILLLDAGRPVPAHRLAELTWAGNPPLGARDVLQTYISRLRRALRDAGDGADDGWLRRQSRGYVADVDPDAVDVHRFHRLVEKAKASDTPGVRSRLLREGLALWRGPALADVGPDAVRERLGARLEESRRQALDLRIAADLATGLTPDPNEDLICELTELAARNPLDERFAGYLMRALCRSSRNQEALRVYETIRKRIREDLGLDPVPELRDLHAAVLRGDSALAPPAASAAPAGRTPTSHAPSRSPAPPAPPTSDTSAVPVASSAVPPPPDPPAAPKLGYGTRADELSALLDGFEAPGPTAAADG